MRSRIVLAFIAAAVLAYACGPRAGRSQQERPVSTKKMNAPGDPMAPSLAVSLRRGIDFAFNVRNASTRRLEIRFPNGKTHDFVVLDSVGRELWRWSDGRMFTQALRNKLVDANGTVAFEDRWDNPPPTLHGTLTAVAVLNSENFPTETRVSFRVP
jgi:hypothetical protein